MKVHDPMREVTKGTRALSAAEDDFETESSSEDEDEDLDPVEYARYYGLTTDHTLAETKMPYLPSLESVDLDLLALQDSPNFVTQISLDEIDSMVNNEKWMVSGECAKFLACIMRKTEDDIVLRDHEVSYKTVTDLRLEEAILSTDPALDLVRLKQRNALRLCTKGITPAELDSNNLWSPTELRLPAELDQRLAQERLDVDSKAMVFLKGLYDLEEIDDTILELEASKVRDHVP
jgi:hypothetical protein